MNGSTQGYRPSNLDLLEDPSTDADVSGKWALPVDVAAIDCFSWSFEAYKENE